MRTLKKSLSLIMVLSMILSLFAFGVAAEDKFTDQKSIEHQEAAEVLSAIGVLNGHQDGSFKPTDKLTRAQGVSIVARLIGQNQAAGTAPFSDCDEAINNAHGFAIQYAYQNGIVAGYGDGRFGPMDPLTGVQFEKMLLTALGYSAEIEGFLGAGWEVGVAKYCRSISLDEGMVGFDPNGEITRDEAAQLAFNALQSTTVLYAVTLGETLTGSNAGETSINTSIHARADDNIDDSKGNTQNNYKSISNGGAGTATPNTQLCEKYFGKLKLDEDYINKDGHLAHRWTYRGEEVCVSARTPAHTIVAGNTKTYSVIIDDYKNTLAPAGAIIYVNGVQQTAALANQTTLLTNARVGDILELYVNDDDISDVTHITITRYSANKVTGDVQTRVSGGVDQVRIPGVVNGWTNADKVYGSNSVAKDDIAYYYVANGDYHVFKAEAIDGVLTAYAAWDDNTPAKYTIDGSAKSINGNARGDLLDGLNQNGRKDNDGGIYNPPTNYNDTYTYYYDNNGYIVYATLKESNNRDYVAVYDLKYSNGLTLAAEDQAEARLVFMDGTTKVVTIDTIDNYKPVAANGVAGSKGTLANQYSKAGTYYYASGVDSDEMVYQGNLTGNVNLTAPTYYNVLSSNSADSAVAERYLALSDNTNDNSAVTRQRLYTYTVGSNGKYSLTSADKGNVRSDVAEDLNNSGNNIVYSPNTARTLPNSIITVNDNTIFIVPTNPNDTNPKFNVYKGKNSAPRFTYADGQTLSAVYAAENGVATYVVVSSYSESTGGSYVFLLENTPNAETTIKYDDGSQTHYYVYKGFVEGSGEVKDLYLTEDANTEANMTKANGGGIGMYIDPEFDEHGNISKLTFSRDRNEPYNVMAVESEYGDVVGAYYFGYRREGTTLQVGKIPGTNLYLDSFDCPDGTIYIRDDDGFHVSDAYDIGDDANDKVYIGLTSLVGDNRTEIVFIQNKDSDSIGIDGIYNTAGAAVAAGARNVTFAGSTATYSEYTMPSGEDITIDFSSGASDVSVTYFNGNATSNYTDYVVTTSGIRFVNAPDVGTYLVLMTAEDTVTTSALVLNITA